MSMNITLWDGHGYCIIYFKYVSDFDRKQMIFYEIVREKAN